MILHLGDRADSSEREASGYILLFECDRADRSELEMITVMWYCPMAMELTDRN